MRTPMHLVGMVSLSAGLVFALLAGCGSDGVSGAAPLSDADAGAAGDDAGVLSTDAGKVVATKDAGPATKGDAGVNPTAFPLHRDPVYGEPILLERGPFNIAWTDAGEVYAGTTAASPMTLYKFTADGKPDQTFGAGGALDISFPATAYAAAQLALDSLGRIVVVGGGGGTAWVARLTSGGALDTSFHAPDGLAPIISGSNTVVAQDLVLLPDDTMLVRWAETAQGTTFPVTRHVRKLLATGAVDTTYGALGDATLPANEDYAAMSLAGDRLMVTGRSAQKNDGSGNANAVVTRLTNAGALDTTFGAGGTMVLAAAGMMLTADLPEGFADGSSLVIGEHTDSDRAHLWRLGASGTLDSTFIGGGQLDVPAYTMFASARTADGHLLVGGSTAMGTGNAAVWAFAANGQAALAFGTNGILNLPLKGTPPAGGPDFVTGLRTLPSGRVMVSVRQWNSVGTQALAMFRLTH